MAAHDLTESLAFFINQHSRTYISDRKGEKSTIVPTSRGCRNGWRRSKPYPFAAFLRCPALEFDDRITVHLQVPAMF
jgi:hypothetical protein